ncbi:integrase [Mycobacterium phage Phayonce]|uniref:Integrase n=1 Tax=Mycobacterium phage Phayonce TaxID=1647302 RepID=A0A0F6SJK8_9CAUD|nr:integrase [Mycobacterium phage Phayonce]AKF14392.1 tyrosine integrase [Mycobacterium phage Phayonce]
MIERWRTWQFAQSLSRRTVDERSATVRRMATWCRVAPELADVEHIVTWLAEGGDGNWSARTRWTYYGALSAWFLWLQQQGYRQDNPMVMIGRPKRPKSVPRPVSNHDVQRLLAVRAHRRTKAMILLAAFQGLRVHEIAQIKGEHLDLIERTMTVTGKGNITATLPVHHRVVEIAYQMPRKGHWFPGPDRGHQRRESISGTIKEAMIRAGVLGSAHCLRHWFGTALLEAGVDLRTVQELMRHQSLTSTEIYTRVTDQRRAEGIERLDPFRMSPIARVHERLLNELLDDDDAAAASAA